MLSKVTPFKFDETATACSNAKTGETLNDKVEEAKIRDDIKQLQKITKTNCDAVKHLTEVACEENKLLVDKVGTLQLHKKTGEDDSVRLAGECPRQGESKSE